MTNLLSKSIIDSVFYVTAPPRKISGQELQLLAELAKVRSSALVVSTHHFYSTVPASLLPQLGGDPLHRPR